MSPASEPMLSPEVAAVHRRMLVVFEARDTDTWQNLMSHSPTLRVVQSDGSSFVEGEQFWRISPTQWQQMPPFELSVGRVEAFELGTVAWSIATFDLTFEGGRALGFRNTAVFVLEEGVWRAMQWHFSVPYGFDTSYGVELTTTLSDLLGSLDGAEVAAHDHEAGLAVLMFTDIKDSTVLAHEMGDEKWRAAIGDHDQLIRTEVGAGGGAVVKTLGDGALVRFTSARAALRCAMRLQAEFASRPFEVRIGLHAGELYDTNDDVIGAAVHKAARVASSAVGGQVVVSSIVKELAAGASDLTFGEPFTAELKGIEGLHELTPLQLDTTPA